MHFGRNYRLFAWAVLTFCVCGCNSQGVTKLADGLQSYQSPSAAREYLKHTDFHGEWKEQEQGTLPSDSRPTYRFLTMSGLFKLMGVEGNLKLVFYNNQLMATEFVTLHGADFISAMQRQPDAVPDKPRVEINLDRRTRFRYDIDSGGAYHFSWRDAKLEDEWRSWVRNNS